MWFVEGAFDQTGDTNLEQTKLKLLKPGKSYPIGRKRKHPLQLVLGHPKISGEHLTLVVGDNPVASVDDLKFKPTLKVQNHRAKTLQVSRTIDGIVTRHLIQPTSEDEVLSGDCIALVTGIYIKIYWRPICCLLPPKSSSISFEKCASLGVKVVPTPRPEVTHHLTATLSASTTIAISLLTRAHLVRPEWLAELLHLGETTVSADGPSVLESDFRLPVVEQFAPTLDATLPDFLKSPSSWKPNEGRVGMLKGWRFLFVGEKGREIDGETRTLLERGGGEYEVFDVSSGLTRWKQSLSRNRRKADAEGGRGISVVESTAGLRIAAGDAWNEMLQELAKAELCFVSRAQLIHAIVLMDTDRLNSRVLIPTERDSSLPDGVPNTYEDKPSPSSGEPHNSILQHPPSSSRQTEPAVNDQGEITRPGSEQDPSQASVKETGARAREEPDGTNVRRRPLVRRARTNATQHVILGVDDPSFVSFSTSRPPSAAVQGNDATPVPPPELQAHGKPSSSQGASTRPSRLKKRARTEKDYNPVLANLEKELAEAAIPPAAQPSLKRFKALFDETDPDRDASQATNGASGGLLDSQLFSQETGANGDGQGLKESSRAPLDTIREEEDEDRTATTAGAVQTDVGMDDDRAVPSRQSQTKAPSEANRSAPRAQTRAFDSTQLGNRMGSKGGAAPGQPDTDAAFLQALASTKKGKRREDEFDREFNNLRISKPEQEKDAEAVEWKVLADFGDDSNIRGNFMVIVEMDVPETHGEASREASVEAGRAQNQGPDFKKFKKKTTGWQRPSVELVADVENDYGMGPAYWKGSQGQRRPQEASQGDHDAFSQQGFLQPSQTQNRAFLQPKAGPSSQAVKPRSQNRTQTQSKAVNSEAQDVPRRTRGRPLQVVEEEAEGKSEEIQPRASRSSRAATNKSKTNGKDQPLFLSDEEEDETRSTEKRSSTEDGGDEELNLDIDDDDIEMFDAEPAAPVLRSTAPSITEVEKPKSSASSSKRAVNSKKRGAALLGDDSDTGVTFKGFGSRKRAKAK